MTTEGFDPHLDLALQAGAVTQEEVDEYKSGNKTDEVTQIRHNYKGGNYACTYGAGLKTLARQLNISEGDADKIHKAYWKRNWSLKKIAKDAEVKTVDGQLWLWNPVSQLYYFLKAEKDKFSTLNQGTGTYCFDMWLGFIIRKRKQLTAQFHDEVILELQETKQEEIKTILKEAIENVNKNLKLNRDLDCDISFGKDYAKIH
jgi:DNA polymerase I-like protein with 3'-5' exonuclease and polymerase domains